MKAGGGVDEGRALSRSGNFVEMKMEAEMEEGRKQEGGTRRNAEGMWRSQKSKYM